MTEYREDRKTSVPEYGAALVALAFAVALSLFSVRNNDIWWLLAVGRYIVETGSFIYSDPFTFTVAGTPWSPQAYLSAIVFFLVHKAGGEAALIGLRMLLVAGIVGGTLWTLRRIKVSWLLALPLLLIMLLTAHTRFIVRAHLFEYLFIVILMGYLLTAHQIKGRSFYAVPVAVQLLWSNMHPSFPLGPALIGAFFLGEWICERGQSSTPNLYCLHERDWKRVLIMLGLVVAACFVNPSPMAFINQVAGPEQRALVARFTLEWKSPFDATMRNAAFHPYYEFLLVLSVLAIGLNFRRLPFACVLPIIATAILSTQSHRFRVEFALVSVPLICFMFKASPVLAGLRRYISGGRGRRMAMLAAAVVSAMLMWPARDRFEAGQSRSSRFPDQALSFIEAHDLGHRAFSTIGFGSYMTWKLYGKRKTFIDGRNFSSALYRDFLTCQSNEAGFDLVAAKYDLDAFIVPALEISDRGMNNLHGFLSRSNQWLLSYCDEIAYVYLRRDGLDERWIEQYGFREYNPLYMTGRRFDAESLDRLIVDLTRAASTAPDYVRLHKDLGMAQTVRGDFAAAVLSYRRASELAPDDAQVWSGMGQAALQAGQVDTAIEAFAVLVGLAGTNANAHFRYATALEAAGRVAEAEQSYRDAIALKSDFAEAHRRLIGMLGQERSWDRALAAAELMTKSLPADDTGFLYLAQVSLELGRVEQAADAATAAVRINPRQLQARLLLAHIHISRGDIGAAMGQLDSVIALDPQNKNALELRERLVGQEP